MPVPFINHQPLSIPSRDIRIWIVNGPVSELSGLSGGQADDMRGRKLTARSRQNNHLSWLIRLVCLQAHTGSRTGAAFDPVIEYANHPRNNDFITGVRREK